MTSELFVVIMWPDIQEYMEIEGFEDNSHLINDEVGIIVPCLQEEEDILDLN